jgi:hypothetical protein
MIAMTILPLPLKKKDDCPRRAEGPFAAILRWADESFFALDGQRIEGGGSHTVPTKAWRV